MFDLAKQTKDDVKPTAYLFDPTTSTDVSMNVDKINDFLGKNPRT